jgi:hypothetical protein
MPERSESTPARKRLSCLIKLANVILVSIFLRVEVLAVPKNMKLLGESSLAVHAISPMTPS